MAVLQLGQLILSRQIVQLVYLAMGIKIGFIEVRKQLLQCSLGLCRLQNRRVTQLQGFDPDAVLLGPLGIAGAIGQHEQQSETEQGGAKNECQGQRGCLCGEPDALQQQQRSTGDGCDQ